MKRVKSSNDIVVGFEEGYAREAYQLSIDISHLGLTTKEQIDYLLGIRHPDFIHGVGGSHVWLSDKEGNRKLLITSENWI